MSLSENVTEKLIEWNRGDVAALNELAPLVYSELHRLAAGYLRGERDHHTLQATALVHEAYLAVRKLDRVEWKNRAHFVGMTAQLMRQILVDHARRRIALKRGGGDVTLSLEGTDCSVPGPDLNLVALDQVLCRFERDFPRQAQVVNLRFFGGLTTPETVEVLRAGDTVITSRTVERDWRFARAWLHKAMSGEHVPER